MLRLHEPLDEAPEGGSRKNHRVQAAACGTLFRLSKALDDPRFELAGDRCLLPLLAGVRGPRAEHRDEAFEVITDGADGADGDRGDLGATALTLLALVEQARARGNIEELPRMRRLARFLLFQQTEEGTPTFHYFYGEARAPIVESQTAPAQASLALVRLSRIDPDNEDLWRQGGERFAGWIMGVRDLGKTYERLRHDPWFLEALTQLYEASGGGRTYYLHGRRMAAGIRRALDPLGETPDSQEAFFLSGRAFDTARRCSALASMVRMAREAGQEERSTVEALERTSSLLLRYRLTVAEAPSRDLSEPALGSGVPDRLKDRDITTRTVLHSLDAWLKYWLLKTSRPSPVTSKDLLAARGKSRTALRAVLSGRIFVVKPR